MSELETLATVAAPPSASASPLHQPARANDGSPLPPIEAHQQKPDAPAAPQSPAVPTPRRGAIPDAAYHAMSPEEQAKYAMVKKPGDQGGSEWVARDRIDADPAAPQPQGEKFKIGQYEVSEAELGAMMQRQAAEDLRKATLPAAPEAYEAKLPADFKAPPGVEFKFDVNDPTMTAARNWAHAKGLSQDEFSQVLGIYAAHEAGKEAALAATARAEIAKVGVNAPQRVDAVARWITAEVGEADAKPIRATLVTDAHLRFYEKVMSKLTSQGTAPFSQQHRERPKEGRASEAEYQSMSPAQRLDYARQFDQRQFNDPR